MQRRRLIRAIFLRPDVAGRAVLGTPGRSEDTAPYRFQRGGQGSTSNSPFGERWQGFRWAGIEAPSSRGKFSHDHIHESTLLLHSWIGRGKGGFLTRRRSASPASWSENPRSK